MSKIKRKIKLVCNKLYLLYKSFFDPENTVYCGKNIRLSYDIKGQNNRIIVHDDAMPSSLKIVIRGNNNCVEIAKSLVMTRLSLKIGNHIPISNASIEIGKNFSCGDGNSYLVYNNKSKIVIGDNCLFSNSINIRTGEIPHLIFNKKTGEYLGSSEGVTIGNHVWLGERVYLLKKSAIANNCVVGTASVVTKAFTEENVAIAGNPATICRKDLHWESSKNCIDKTSMYYKNLPTELQ